MKRLIKIIAAFFLSAILIYGCSEQGIMKSEPGIVSSSPEHAPVLAGESADSVDVYYLQLSDWNRVSPIEPNIFYRFTSISLAKQAFSDDPSIIEWLDSFPSETNDAPLEDIELKVTVYNNLDSSSTSGPQLAADEWYADADITPIYGGSKGFCITTTRNPGVCGYKSHQIWVYKIGQVYYANYQSYEDCVSHIVSFEHTQSVDQGTTIYCLARIIKDWELMNDDLDSYTRE